MGVVVVVETRGDERFYICTPEREALGRLRRAVPPLVTEQHNSFSRKPGGDKRVYK